ncbi:Rv3235 family protein [Streptomyces sp. XD-27]|uniref:Rv3235 family protein n=1 Tax=Streptomyces sp. XD-27 TaxID=3062779 RepID=UPI0026F44ADC|nr:Rv3235 family protein [Streptomyces sp. XD-27]WKX70673.1 Rv3235 family protein [Streptomyces sp. XD-27]
MMNRNGSTIATAHRAPADATARPGTGRTEDVPTADRAPSSPEAVPGADSAATASGEGATPPRCGAEAVDSPPAVQPAGTAHGSDPGPPLAGAQAAAAADLAARAVNRAAHPNAGTAAATIAGTGAETIAGTTPSRAASRTAHRAAPPRVPAQSRTRPSARTGPPGRRDARRPGGTRLVSAQATAAARRQAREHLPRYWFAHRLLLTLSGQRPVHILLGHALPEAYDQLVALAPQAPLRTVSDGAATAPYLERCGEYQPRDGVIEAFARIASGDRLRAFAFRLERGPDDRWRCAAVEVGPTQHPR